MRRRLVPLATLAVVIVVGWCTPAEAETSGPLCGGFITIQVGGPASPYPSQCEITGRTGTIADVDVSIRNLTHGWPDRIDMLLVGPGGENAIVMSDAGGSLDAIDADLTLDDGAGVPQSPRPGASRRLGFPVNLRVGRR